MTSRSNQNASLPPGALVSRVAGKARRLWLWPPLTGERFTFLTAQQEGARFAPLSFVSDSLFSGDIHQIDESLTQPVWMSRGIRGDFTDFRAQGLRLTGTPW